MNYYQIVKEFIPGCEQEESDKARMLELMDHYGDEIVNRTAYLGHTTASGLVINKTRDKVLMVYHNIYRSWAWSGGHCDGETDPLETARREVLEETGIKTLTLLGDGPVSIELLSVIPHIKRGKYISSHLHINYTYLFEGDEEEILKICEEENSNVGWLPIDDIESYVTEFHMIPIYKKVFSRIK